MISTPMVLPHGMLNLFSLLVRSGGELSRLLGEVHHTLRQRPLPWDQHHQPDSELAPPVYQWLQRLSVASAANIHRLMEYLPAVHEPPQWRPVRSALNGVLGDKLMEWQHPLAIDMTLVDEAGHRVMPEALHSIGPKGTLIFIHGLCLNENNWRCEAHQAFVQSARSAGYGVAWLRYNTGLPIWKNGEQFSALLERWRNSNTNSGKLRLIGHSMGGLLIRSAHWHATSSQQAWIDYLTHAAYIASPHSGAPMEKLGHFANRILGVTPYTKPFMSLGNIRSQGIRSLRHGWLTEAAEKLEANLSDVPFQECHHQLLVGGRRFYDVTNRWLGDGWVPVTSAMAEQEFPANHPMLSRLLLEQIGHIEIIRDPRLYESLERWLS